MIMSIACYCTHSQQNGKKDKILQNFTKQEVGSLLFELVFFISTSRSRRQTQIKEIDEVTKKLPKKKYRHIILPIIRNKKHFSKVVCNFTENCARCVFVQNESCTKKFEVRPRC